MAEPGGASVKAEATVRVAADVPEATAAPPRFGYRWTICAMLFFATTINYVDRQTLSVLAPELRARFHMSNTDYSRVIFAFLLALRAGVCDGRADAAGRRGVHYRRLPRSRTEGARSGRLNAIRVLENAFPADFLSDVDRLPNHSEIIADDADVPAAVARDAQPGSCSGQCATAVQQRPVHVAQMHGGLCFRCAGQLTARQFEFFHVIADQGRPLLGFHKPGLNVA